MKSPRMPGRLLLPSLLSLTLLLVAPVWPQQADPPLPAKPTKEQKESARKAAASQKQPGLKVDAGYLVRPRRAKGEAYDETYYRLEFNGKQVGARGEPFKDSPFTSEVPLPDKPDGDTPDLFLRFENGAGTAAGPLADYLKIQPFNPSAKNFLSQMRGVAQLYGQVESRQVSIAIGLEGPPIAPITKLVGSEAGVTNWLILGLQGASETKPGAAAATASANSAAPKKNELGLVTWRSYIAYSAGYVYSATSRELQSAMTKIADSVNRADPASFSTRNREINSEKFLNEPALQSLNDTQKKEAQTLFADFFTRDAPLVRLLRGPGKGPLAGVGSIQKKEQILEDPQNWELDVQNFLKELKADQDVANAGPDKEVRKLVREHLKRIFGVEAPPNANPGAFPVAPRFPDLVEYYRTDMKAEPTSEQKIETVMALNLAISEKLLLGVTPPVTGEVPPEDAARLAERKTLLDLLPLANNALTPPRAADPLRVLAAGPKTGVVDQVYANRLLVERAFRKTADPQTADPQVSSLRGLTETVKPVSGSVTLPKTTVWKAKINAFIADTFFLPDRPRFTYALENIGQAVAAGKPDGPRFRNLLGATFTYFLNPDREDRQWIRLRFENGRDRALPTQRRNLLTVTFGFDL